MNWLSLLFQRPGSSQGINKPFLVSLSHPALLLNLQPKPTQMVLRMKTWNLPLMANKSLPHRVPVMPRVPGPWLVLHSAWQHCWSQSWSLAGVAIRPFKERAAVWWSHWFPLSATQLMSKEAYEFELPRNFFSFFPNLTNVDRKTIQRET